MKCDGVFGELSVLLNDDLRHFVTSALRDADLRNPGDGRTHEAFANTEGKPKLIQLLSYADGVP